MKFDDFPGFPWEAQGLSHEQVGGKNMILGPGDKLNQGHIIADSQTTSADDLITVQIYLIT